MKVHFDSETRTGLVEPAGFRTPPRAAVTVPMAEDYWISQGQWDHFTLPMSLQCRLFPRTTLGVKPPRDRKESERYGRK